MKKDEEGVNKSIAHTNKKQEMLWTYISFNHCTWCICLFPPTYFRFGWALSPRRGQLHRSTWTGKHNIATNEPRGHFLTSSVHFCQACCYMQHPNDITDVESREDFFCWYGFSHRLYAEKNRGQIAIWHSLVPSFHFLFDWPHHTHRYMFYHIFTHALMRVTNAFVYCH